MFDATSLQKAKHLHFIGIGGSGMFPIVQILHGQGYRITGSDNNESDIVAAERKMGIPVTIGQKAENIDGADMIIYTAAVMNDNPELIAARASGVSLAERAEILGYLTSLYNDCICICGTHGKTTVTAMLTQTLLEAGLDPSAVIGGKLAAIGGYGRSGNSSLLVCESCEFKDHFLQLHPDISVILNVDDDHLDYFGSIDNIIKSFHRFAEKTSRVIVVNGDDSNAMQAVAGIPDKQIITFGWGEQNDYRPANYRVHGAKSEFDLYCDGKRLAEITLSIPGRHNVLNAVAVFTAAVLAGASIGKIVDGIAAFHGAGRRFEVLGEVRGITIADDYAHHPAEIMATLCAAKDLRFRKIWAVFQPFTFSRTKLLMDDFAKVLKSADHVVLSEIMAGREKNTDGVYASQLADKISGAVWFAEFPEIADYVMQNAQKGDLVITLGCGDVYKCARMMMKKG